MGGAQTCGSKGDEAGGVAEILPQPISADSAALPGVAAATTDPVCRYALYESHATEVWAFYEAALNDGAGADNAEGIAAKHSKRAREEAATKLIRNHINVIADVTNPSKTDNIDGKPLTQTELFRVDHASKPYIDWMLREVARRLLGNRKGLAQLAEKANGRDTEQARSWRSCATYLGERTQSNRFQKAGRDPDMSVEGAAAFFAVIQEVAFEAEVSHPMWAHLEAAIKDPSGADKADGEAAKHSPQAREAAAVKLIGNHRAVICDVTNPSKEHNIYGFPNTQTWLARVEPEGKVYVDQIFRETARRLLGRRQGMDRLAQRPDPSNPTQAKAFKTAHAYLKDRTQSKPEQKRGRDVDMHEAANAAFLGVMEEIALEAEKASA